MFNRKDDNLSLFDTLVMDNGNNTSSPLKKSYHRKETYNSMSRSHHRNGTHNISRSRHRNGTQSMSRSHHKNGTDSISRSLSYRRRSSLANSDKSFGSRRSGNLGATIRRSYIRSPAHSVQYKRSEKLVSRNENPGKNGDSRSNCLDNSSRSSFRDSFERRNSRSNSDENSLLGDRDKNNKRKYSSPEPNISKKKRTECKEMDDSTHAQHNDLHTKYSKEKVKEKENHITKVCPTEAKGGFDSNAKECRSHTDAVNSQNEENQSSGNTPEKESIDAVIPPIAIPRPHWVPIFRPPRPPCYFYPYRPWPMYLPPRWRLPNPPYWNPGNRFWISY